MVEDSTTKPEEEALPQSGEETPRSPEAAAATERPRVRSSFYRRRRPCPFCLERSRTIDYKRVDLLRRFISDRGRIETRRRAGTCAKHQRRLAVAIKRARHLALLPYTSEHIRKTGSYYGRR